jgi:hypothetical protein
MTSNEEYLNHNFKISLMYTKTTMDNFDKSITQILNNIDTIHKKYDTDIPGTLGSLDSIKNSSLDMMDNCNLLKIALDRLLLPMEDTIIPKRRSTAHRRSHRRIMIRDMRSARFKDGISKEALINSNPLISIMDDDDDGPG